MISKRKMLILKAIVEEYVRTAEPVGSKYLTERPEFQLNVSSATIRNDMAELEQAGLIIKTHSSSGRVPSEEGYKLYVEYILNQDKTPNVESFPMIDEIFKRDLISREQAIKETMSLVSDLTNYASIAMGSYGYNARIKKLQFIPITGQTGVILMVTDHGNVESKKIIIPDDINIRDIDKVINVLNELLYDCPITKIDQTIKSKLGEERIGSFIYYHDELVSTLVRIFTDMAKDRYYLSGQSKILTQPEFQNITKAKDLISAIENQEIFKAININNNGITVRIGKDNQIKAMQDCTVITVPYEVSDGEFGAIAVLGPTRMDYQKIIPLLEYIASNIKKII